MELARALRCVATADTVVTASTVVTEGMEGMVVSTSHGAQEQAQLES